jgi:hypothetical protein
MAMGYSLRKHVIKPAIQLYNITSINLVKMLTKDCKKKNIVEKT